MKRILLISILSICILDLFAQADKIIGVYDVTEKGEVSKVQIYKKANGNYEGRVIWMKNPNFKDGTPKTDLLNPDEKLRQTPADKIVILKDFKYNEKNGEWQGLIYNPTEGKTYKAFAKFEAENKLKVRGYIGIPALGRTVHWNKVK